MFERYGFKVLNRAETTKYKSVLSRIGLPQYRHQELGNRGPTFRLLARPRIIGRAGQEKAHAKLQLQNHECATLLRHSFDQVISDSFPHFSRNSTVLLRFVRLDALKDHKTKLASLECIIPVAMRANDYASLIAELNSRQSRQLLLMCRNKDYWIAIERLIEGNPETRRSLFRDSVRPTDAVQNLAVRVNSAARGALLLLANYCEGRFLCG